MAVVFRPGFWTDVCVLADGRFAQVTTDGPTVRCFVDGVLAWQRDAPVPIGQCRAALTPQGVLSIHQGNKEGDPDDGTAFLVSESGVTPLGKTYGVQPVAIDASHLYIVRSTTSYDRITLATGEVEHLPHGVPGSSQGISDVEPDGTIRWADTWRTLSWDGLTLSYPNTRGGIVVGQADPPQVAGFGFGPIGKFTAIPGIAFEPHLAQSGDRYAIVARTPQGAAYVEVPPYPAFLSAPIDPPNPQPAPKPEPIPVSLPDPVAVLAALNRERKKFPAEVIGNAEMGAILNAVALQFPDMGMHRKDGEKAASVPGLNVTVSRDILRVLPAGDNFGWWSDVLGATGAGLATPQAPSWQRSTDDAGSFVRPVRPSAPVPPADPPVKEPPPPVVDLSHLEAEIAEIRARLAKLESKPSPVTYRVLNVTLEPLP